MKTNKDIIHLSELSGCPFHECRNALDLCEDVESSYYYLMLTNQAVVRYKNGSNGMKWTQQDYISEAKKLAKHKRP